MLTEFILAILITSFHIVCVFIFFIGIIASIGMFFALFKERRLRREFINYYEHKNQ